MMDIIKELDGWFTDRLQGLHYKPETIAYVGGVLKRLARPREEDDFANRSVVLAFQNASLKGDFAGFQQIGDWVLWVDIIMPSHLDANREAIESIGRMSYYSCHRILHGTWGVYEELADELPAIAQHARRMLV